MWQVVRHINICMLPIFSVAIKLCILCSHPRGGLWKKVGVKSWNLVKPERTHWLGIRVIRPFSQTTSSRSCFNLFCSWVSGMRGSICCPFTFSWSSFPKVCVSNSQTGLPWRNRSMVETKGVRQWLSFEAIRKKNNDKSQGNSHLPQINGFNTCSLCGSRRETWQVNKTKTSGFDKF